MMPVDMARTSLLDAGAGAAGLVEIIGVHRLYGVEQGVLRGVVAPVAQVQASDEGHQLPHFGIPVHKAGRSRPS